MVSKKEPVQQEKPSSVNEDAVGGENAGSGKSRNIADRKLCDFTKESTETGTGTGTDKKTNPDKTTNGNGYCGHIADACSDIKNTPNKKNDGIRKYDNDTPVWFAMSATFSRSLKVQEKLERKGVESYVPVRLGIIKGKDGHSRKALIPVISNLIFVNVSWNSLVQIKKEIPILQMQTFPTQGRNVPIVVPRKQMEDFISVTSHLKENDEGKGITYLNPEEINLMEGKRVRIIGGPFNNVEGVLMNTKGRGKRRELIVEIPHIIAARTTIKDYDLIEVVEERRAGETKSTGRSRK